MLNDFPEHSNDCFVLFTLQQDFKVALIIVTTKHFVFDCLVARFGVRRVPTGLYGPNALSRTNE
jgi:hypothetical protein